MKRSLLIGCGNSRVKHLYQGDNKEWTGELTTLDMNPNCGADIVVDMDDFVVRKKPLPFPDETFDEIGAYNCMEHWGRQGDWRGWFDEMAEYHRILKPGGLMGIVVPICEDALADPGHTRFFQRNYFGFLNQTFYARNLELGTAMTDYRWYYRKNFDVLFMETQGNHHLAVLLRKA